MDSDGLIAAIRFDGRGGGEALGWSGLSPGVGEAGLLWVHLDYTVDHARDWLCHHSGLDPLVVQALIQEETRPRAQAMGEGMLVMLRGVSMNPGCDPEDMVSLRIWIEPGRIITTRRRRLLSVDDLRRSLVRGDGPATEGQFLAFIADRLVARMADAVERIDDQVNALEHEVLESKSHQMRGVIAGVRRQAISLRRYLAPQREAMTRAAGERPAWLTDLDRLRLREVTDRVTRYVEDLDAARERAAVSQEQLVARLSEQMNHRMYIVSIVAAIFLPLGFVTGLLGINVGGIPGSDQPWAFALVSLLLALVVAGQLWLLRFLRWL